MENIKQETVSYFILKAAIARKENIIILLMK